MISEFYKDMTGKGSVIREFFTYAMKKAAEIGPENIFNYSITHFIVLDNCNIICTVVDHSIE